MARPRAVLCCPLADAPAAAIALVKRAASCGRVVIPVIAEIGRISFPTSLFPRDGSYLLPLKHKVRCAAGIRLAAKLHRLNTSANSPTLENTQIHFNTLELSLATPDQTIPHTQTSEDAGYLKTIMAIIAK